MILGDRYQQEQRFEVDRYMEVIGRRRYLILTFCLSASLTSLALTYVFSEKYLAYTTILYRPQEAVRFQPRQQEALGFPVPFVLYESIGNTLEELAKSDAVTQQVVSKLHLDREVEKPASNWLIHSLRAMKDELKGTAEDAWQILRYGRTIEKDPFVDAVRSLQKNMAIKPTKKAYTFRLEALDTDPARAAAIVDTEAQVLADFLRSENVRVARQAKQELAARLNQNLEEIGAARTALERFKKNRQVISLSEETSLQLKKIAGLQEELTKTQNELRGMEKRRDELRARLREQEQFVKYLSTTTDNPIVQEMKLELARLEVQRSGLLQKFTPDHQDVKTVDAKLEQVKEKLRKEVEKIVSSESVRLNDIYQKVLSDELSAEADIQALKEKQKSLADQVSRESNQLKGLTEKEAPLAELTLQLEVAERSYKLLNDAYEEARIAESKGISEVAILNPSLVPSAPVQPIKIVHFASSALLSLILVFGYVFFLNFFDSTLRSIDHVKQVLNVPVLATIPTITNPRVGDLEVPPTRSFA